MIRRIGPIAATVALALIGWLAFVSPARADGGLPGRTPVPPVSLPPLAASTLTAAAAPAGPAPATQSNSPAASQPVAAPIPALSAVTSTAPVLPGAAQTPQPPVQPQTVPAPTAGPLAVAAAPQAAPSAAVPVGPGATTVSSAASTVSALLPSQPVTPAVQNVAGAAVSGLLPATPVTPEPVSTPMPGAPGAVTALLPPAAAPVSSPVGLPSLPSALQTASSAAQPVTQAATQAVTAGLPQDAGAAAPVLQTADPVTRPVIATVQGFAQPVSAVADQASNAVLTTVQSAPAIVAPLVQDGAAAATAITDAVLPAVAAVAAPVTPNVPPAELPVPAPVQPLTGALLGGNAASISPTAAGLPLTSGLLPPVPAGPGAGSAGGLSPRPQAVAAPMTTASDAPARAAAATELASPVPASTATPPLASERAAILTRQPAADAGRLAELPVVTREAPSAGSVSVAPPSDTRSGATSLPSAGAALALPARVAGGSRELTVVGAPRSAAASATRPAPPATVVPDATVLEAVLPGQPAPAVSDQIAEPSVLEVSLAAIGQPYQLSVTPVAPVAGGQRQGQDAGAAVARKGVQQDRTPVLSEQLSDPARASGPPSDRPVAPVSAPVTTAGTATPAGTGGVAFHLWASALFLLSVALFLLGGPGQKSRRPACRRYAPVIPPA